MTLAIAIAGLSFAALSLGWQVWIWRSGGPKVHVTTRRGASVPEGRPLFIIEASNRGRSPVRVLSAFVELSSGVRLFNTVPIAGSAPSNHWLEAHDAASFLFNLDEVAHEAAGEPVRGAVGLASRDKPVRSDPRQL